MHYKILLKTQETPCMGKCNEQYRNTFCCPLSQVRFVKNVTSWKEMKPGFYHGHISYLDFAKYVPVAVPAERGAGSSWAASALQCSEPGNCSLVKTLTLAFPYGHYLGLIFHRFLLFSCMIKCSPVSFLKNHLYTGISIPCINSKLVLLKIMAFL